MKRNTSSSGGSAVLEAPGATSAPEPQPQSAAKPTLKRVSFGKAAVKKEETKTAYPVFDDKVVGDQVRAIAARVKDRADQIESLEGAQTTDKAELKMFVGPFYFKTNQNRIAPPSSISIPSSSGEVLVTFANRYSKMESEAALIPIIGEAAVAEFFRQSFELKIKGEELPTGKEQQIVDEIIALLDKYNAGGALEVKEQIKPTKEFHVARLSRFTPEVNLAIEQACPIVAMVKTKGRGE